MSEVSYANQEQLFILEEDTKGTLKKPAATGSEDKMWSVGPVDLGQDQEFLDNEELTASASRLASIAARIPPGSFSLDTYVKPGGVACKPEHAALFKALMGAEAAVLSTYEYTLTSELPSISIWSKKGDTVFACRGATVEGADFAIAGDSIALISWSGKYMRELRAGTAYCASIAGAVLTMEASGCKRFSEGMYVTVGIDNSGLEGAGQGFKILHNNPAGNTMTLDASPIVAGKQLITPWWPASPWTGLGNPQHGKLGIVKVNNRQTVVTNASVSMVNNIKYYEDEKNNVMTAENYGRPGRREIEGTLDLYFTAEGAGYWYNAEYQERDALIIPVGKVPGSIMELQIPLAEYRTPKLSGDAEFKEGIPFIAIATKAALNEEFKIIFK